MGLNGPPVNGAPMVMVLLTLDSGNLDLVAGLLAIAIVIGGFLMMFTNLWTKR